MKQLLGGAVLIAMLSAGCSNETGVEGTEGTEEVAGEESLGSTSEALTTGFWLPTFLAPLAPMQLPAGGLQVCRSIYSPGISMPGYTDGATCHYAYDGFGRHTTVFQRVERTDLSWVNLTYVCGSRGQICVNPNVVAKMVGTAGYGICAVQVNGGWRSGFFTNNACYTANTSGNGYVRTPFSVLTTMKALIKN